MNFTKPCNISTKTYAPRLIILDVFIQPAATCREKDYYTFSNTSALSSNFKDYTDKDLRSNGQFEKGSKCASESLRYDVFATNSIKTILTNNVKKIYLRTI